MRDKFFRYGDRIQWTYIHHLNRNCRFRRTRTGYFIGLIKHTRKHWQYSDSVQMAKVHFDGNRYKSVVPRDELEAERQEDRR